MVTRLVGDKEGKGEGGKGDVDGDEGGGREEKLVAPLIAHLM